MHFQKGFATITTTIIA